MNAHDPRAVLGPQSLPQALYRRLIGKGRGSLNEIFVAQMVASWTSGGGALPRCMGLEEKRFEAMLEWHFPGIGYFQAHHRHELPAPRQDEFEDLRALLLEHRLNRSDSEIWIAELVAIGCMASDHLWSDLGLFSRKYLTQMMQLNFQPLAMRNTNNMKWKKFLYKQLCAREGIYVCRAPSCEACADYAKCFIEGEA